MTLYKCVKCNRQYKEGDKGWLWNRTGYGYCCDCKKYNAQRNENVDVMETALENLLKTKEADQTSTRVVEAKKKVSELHVTMHEKLPALVEKVPALVEKVPALEEKMKTLEEKVPALEEKVPALEKKMETLEKKVENEIDLPMLEVKMLEMQATIQEKVPALEEKVEKVPVLEAKYSELHKQVTANKVAIQDTNVKIKQIEKDTKVEVQKLKCEMEKEKKKADVEIEKYKAQQAQSQLQERRELNKMLNKIKQSEDTYIILPPLQNYDAESNTNWGKGSGDNN